MNRFNPEKLLRSKWTACQPSHRSKHFVVIGLIRDDDQRVAKCELEAVISHEVLTIDCSTLKNPEAWQMGWK